MFENDPVVQIEDQLTKEEANQYLKNGWVLLHVGFSNQNSSFMYSVGLTDSVKNHLDYKTQCNNAANKFDLDMDI